MNSDYTFQELTVHSMWHTLAVRLWSKAYLLRARLSRVFKVLRYRLHREATRPRFVKITLQSF